MSYEIRRLGHHGDGIADGPIFAPRTLPGEVVDGVLDGDTLTKPKILEPSDQRVKAPCPTYNTCGGCSVQHASDPFVREWKVDVVRSALRSRGMEMPLRDVHVSPLESRRRAKLTGRRTKAGAIVGFHGRGATVLADASRCMILRPAIRNLIAPLEELTRKYGPRKGEVAFHVTETDSGLDLSIDGAKPPTPQEGMGLMRWAMAHNVIRLAVNGEVLGQEAVPKLGKLLPPPGAFLQATEAGEAALIKSVLSGVAGAKLVADLFAGCGTFSLPLAVSADVLAVEGEVDLTQAAETSWRQTPGLHQMRFETRDLFRRPLMPDELNRFDAVVIDPPRAGAEAQVAELVQSSVKRVVAVSCNPVTLARDLAMLAQAGFVLDWVDVVDQFRWSHHVEVAVGLSRT